LRVDFEEGGGMIVAEKEFNLLAERWILVLNEDAKTEELSLLDVLERAHSLTGLAGELPTQDVAILRLLLAVLYATFTRADESGARAPLQTAEEALKRWEVLWKLGKFPMEPIKKRLGLYEERFYLFHPERPFYQVAGMDKGTEYKAAKLLGDLSESNNKVRLFQIRNGAAKKALSYAEAARWLLYLNAFDDTSSKPTRNTGTKLPSPGAGWLGKLGLICAVGDNLFETLMLNFSLLDNKGQVWDDGCAVWELDSVKTAERTEIPMPRCQMALLTLQSRRLLLERNGEDIVGYKLLGGDFFQKENAFSEQMTIWRRDSTSREEIYVPKRHDVSKQLWRSFASLVAKSSVYRQSGVISWLSVLEGKRLILGQIKIQASSVKYGDKDFFVDDIGGDSLALSSAILSELDDSWVTRIVDLLAATDECVKKLGYLASDLAAAAGDKNGGSGKRSTAMEEAYFRLDNPFRIWLAAINPQLDDMGKMGNLWKEQMRDIVLALGNDLIREAGDKAFIGIAVKINSREELVNAPKAYMKFKAGINNILNR
jgi:CRISPR system Cascade subunit CasA